MSGGNRVQSRKLSPAIDAMVYFTVSGGVPSIQKSVNVSSITDHAVGNFTANFTSPLRSSSYAVSGIVQNASINNYGLDLSGYAGGMSASSYRFYCTYYDPRTYYDPAGISLTFTGA